MFYVQDAPDASYDLVNIGMFEKSSFEHTKNHYIPKTLEGEFPGARIACWWHDISDLNPIQLAEQPHKLLAELRKLRQPQKHTRKRPIVFVSQGAGGVVLKTVLLEIVESAEKATVDRDLLDCISGIFFLGCVHDELSYDGFILGLMIEYQHGGMVNGKLSAPGQKSLPEFKKWLEGIQVRFGKLKLAFPVRTYYETIQTACSIKRTLFGREKIVSVRVCHEYNARLGASSHTTDALQLSHYDLCSIAYRSCRDGYRERFLDDLGSMINVQILKKPMVATTAGVPRGKANRPSASKNFRPTEPVTINSRTSNRKLVMRMEDSSHRDDTRVLDKSMVDRSVIVESESRKRLPGTASSPPPPRPLTAYQAVLSQRQSSASRMGSCSTVRGNSPFDPPTNPTTAQSPNLTRCSSDSHRGRNAYGRPTFAAEDRVSPRNQAWPSSNKYGPGVRQTAPAIMDYKLGWICALPYEAAAAEVMLDEQYPNLPLDPYDSTLYTLGRVGPHNVVIACLPRGRPGLSAATAVARGMLSKFRSIKFGFMVGIGGGVPSSRDDIRLGDVVVSQPNLVHGGVVQYDFGKAEAGGKFCRTGHLNNPPTLLLSVLNRIQINHERGRRTYSTHMLRYTEEDMEQYCLPQNERDVLFNATYPHASYLDCTHCDSDETISRPPRNMKSTTIKIHYGTIASGNQVIKDAQTRDQIVKDLGGQILCFEMEAAGLMNDFPCLVVRGISDYCDSHKNDGWQRYAAASAAAYTRELLLLIPSEDVAG